MITEQKRFHFLDVLRGIAVIWMIVFHFFYDLNEFRFIYWNFKTGFWYAFPRVIAFTFLFCVGLSLHYGHFEKFQKNAFLKRLLKLFVAALTISIVTFFSFPLSWIYFGTLHCIFAGSLLGIWFVYHRKSAFVLMIIILLGQYVFGYDIAWVSSITNKFSMDFIPIYPWFWVILLGILLAPYLQKFDLLMKIRSTETLDFLGRHSLMIYLIHQPLIFGLLMLVKQIR